MTETQRLVVSELLSVAAESEDPKTHQIVLNRVSSVLFDQRKIWRLSDSSIEDAMVDLKLKLKDYYDDILRRNSLNPD